MRWLRGFLTAVTLCLASTRALAESRVALIIGVGAYKHVTALANPTKDAHLVAQSLRATGFAVTELIDPDYALFGQAITRFRAKAQTADVAIVYYAGHGVEVDGVNWLLPSTVVGDAPEDLQFEAIRTAAIVDVVSPARKIRMVVLDACRNNPFKASRGWTNGRRSFGGRGLAREAAGNVVVLMATQPGDTAADGAGQVNSPFAASLARLIQEPALRLSSLPGRISRDVRQRTGSEQAPDQQGIFDEPDWMFVPGQQPPPKPALPVAAAESGADNLEAATWELCSRGTTAAPCRRYQQRYPQGRFASLIFDRLKDFDQATVPVPQQLVAQPTMVATDELIARLGIIVRRESSPAEGIRITTVQPNTPAQGRVFGGDLIVRINGLPIDVSRTAAQILADALAGKAAVRLTVQRGISQITAILRP